MIAAFSQQKYHHYAFAFIFALLLMGYFITGNEVLFYGLSFLLILSASFLFSFIDSHWLLMLLCFALPFSVQADIVETGLNVFFPSEILAGIFAGTAVIKIARGEISNSKFLRHPVTVLIFVYFFLTMVTGWFSTMLAVSLKSMFVKGTYLLVFYFLVFDAMQYNRAKSFLIYIACYAIALAPVIIYALTRFSEYGSGKDAADFSVLPFYKDHTIYSVCVAFLIPVFAFKTFRSGRENNLAELVLNVGILMLLFTGLFFSFSRAAWISVIAAFVFLIILIFKIRPFVLLIVSVLISVFLYQYSDSFLASLKKNKNDSNIRNADLETQTKSIVNISTDQSNAERLNRWKCALRMFNDKPLTGFGSGAYMFKYFDYQWKADMTYISVTSPYHVAQGHGGSVHSEYLLVLSENGIFTFIVFFILAVKMILTGMKNVYRHPDKMKRMEAAALTLSLVTYLVHGFFNNYLDTDKAAFLFWSSVCMIVIIDLSRINLEKEK
ncbi:MAG: O-antigen ligase family protein [Bacteroidota bacterium]